METNKIEILHDLINSYEFSLNDEEISLFKISLEILKQENKFTKIFLWGKLKDYCISYGFKNDFLDRIFYYSMNCIDWYILPTPSDILWNYLTDKQNNFTGDPSFHKEIEFFSKSQYYETKLVSEEYLLAVTVAQITKDAMIVPRGAVFKRSDGTVTENKAFQGLNYPKIKTLENFYHSRKPIKNWKENVTTLNNFNASFDFLDALDESFWSMQLQEYERRLLMKNLEWPGVVFYHTLNTNDFGWLYVGDGNENHQVKHMISC